MSLPGGVRARGYLYREGSWLGEGCPCVMKFNASWVLVTWDCPQMWTEWQTDRHHWKHCLAATSLTHCNKACYTFLPHLSRPTRSKIQISKKFLNEWNVNFLCHETFKSTIIVESTVKCQILKQNLRNTKETKGSCLWGRAGRQRAEYFVIFKRQRKWSWQKTRTEDTRDAIIFDQNSAFNKREKVAWSDWS